MKYLHSTVRILSLALVFLAFTNYCDDSCSVISQDSSYQSWKDDFLQGFTYFDKHVYDRPVIAALQKIINDSQSSKADILHAYNMIREHRCAPSAGSIEEADLPWALNENGSVVRLMCKCKVAAAALFLSRFLCMACEIEERN